MYSYIWDSLQKGVHNIGSYTYIYIYTCKSRVERSRLVEPTPSSRLASSRWTGCVKLTETQELIMNLRT